jgi:hypothetical protein
LLYTSHANPACLPTVISFDINLSQKFSKLKKATETAAPTAPSVTPGPTQPKQKAAPATTKGKRKAATTTDDDIDPMAKQSKQIKKEPSNDEQLYGGDGGDANHGGGGVYHEMQEGYAMNGDARVNANKAEGVGEEAGGTCGGEGSDAADWDDDEHQNGINTED